MDFDVDALHLLFGAIGMLMLSAGLILWGSCFGLIWLAKWGVGKWQDRIQIEKVS